MQADVMSQRRLKCNYFLVNAQSNVGRCYVVGPRKNNNRLPISTRDDNLRRRRRRDV